MNGEVIQIFVFHLYYIWLFTRFIFLSCKLMVYFTFDVMCDFGFISARLFSLFSFPNNVVALPMFEKIYIWKWFNCCYLLCKLKYGPLGFSLFQHNIQISNTNYSNKLYSNFSFKPPTDCSLYCFPIVHFKRQVSCGSVFSPVKY